LLGLRVELVDAHKHSDLIVKSNNIGGANGNLGSGSNEQVSRVRVFRNSPQMQR
jgi:hypothetical protein